MSNKFERVLSDEELAGIFEGMGYAGGHGTFLDVANEVQQATLAKLAEQEPVAVVGSGFQLMYRGGAAISEIESLKVGMMLYAHPYVTPVSDKAACVSENAESEGQDIELLKQALETMIRAAHPAHVQDDLLREKLIKARDTAFKALETNRLNAKEHHRTTKNSDKPHLIGAKVYTAEETEFRLSYIKRYQKWRRGEDKTMDEAGLTPKQIGEALDWLIGVADDHIADKRKMVGSDHIPDAGQMVDPDADKVDAGRYRWLRDPKNDVALVLDKRTGYVPEDEQIPGVGGYHTYEYRAGVELDAAIDATRGQCQGCDAEDKSSALAENRASKMVVPDGWQLVPKEPDEKMRTKGGETAVQARGTWEDAAVEAYKTMLEAAPKPTL